MESTDFSVEYLTRVPEHHNKCARQIWKWEVSGLTLRDQGICLNFHDLSLQKNLQMSYLLYFHSLHSN